MTKLIYEMWSYFCISCGRRAWDARIPAGHDPKGARPAECGKCAGRVFREERAA